MTRRTAKRPAVRVRWEFSDTPKYVNRFRVDRAKRLLADPQSQVKLVAQQVGFENVNTFIRVFKSFEGISPGVYKETLLKKELDADPR